MDKIGVERKYIRAMWCHLHCIIYIGYTCILTMWLQESCGNAGLKDNGSSFRDYHIAIETSIEIQLSRIVFVLYCDHPGLSVDRFFASIQCNR